MDSTYLPLLRLPVELQHMLATYDRPERRHVLACSPTTSDEVLRVLARDKIRTIQHVALRYLRDPDELEHRFDSSSDCCKAAIARNPFTPAHLLSDAARSSNDELKLAALVNPSTPTEARDGLDAATADKLCDVGSFLGARVVRSHELIHQNRHLLADVSTLTPLLRRAAIGLWDLTMDQFDTLRRAGRSKFAPQHPLNHHEQGARGLAIDELIGLQSPAADLYLAELPDLDITDARKMLTRERFDPEPHIIGRLLRRFGYDVIPDRTNRKTIAGTRTSSGAWHDPLVLHYNKVLIARYASTMTELENVATIIGDDLSSWKNFLHLEQGWSGTLTELASASVAL